MEQATLHTLGFQVYSKMLPEDMLKAVREEAQRQQTRKTSGARAIFNHNAQRKRNDYKRTQTPLRASNKVARAFHQHVTEFISQNFGPSLSPKNMVVLHSKSGCQRQMPHTDYIPTPELLAVDDADMPLGCVIALETGTKIHLWPHSIRQEYPDEDTLATGGLLLPLSPGDALVFRGDLVHAGAAYNRPNTRVHVYIDSTRVPRTRNQTYFIIG